MKQISVLAIAPYEGLKERILEVASERDDVKVDAYVGDLKEGANLVKKLGNRDYEVIVSRGGTAEEIRKVTTLPVVEISISVYDILRGIKMIETFADDFVIIGFGSFTSCAAVVCNLLQYKVEIYTILEEKEAQEYLKQIREKHGNQCVILCDKITNYYAGEMGLRSILITSGQESIDTVLNEAVQIGRNGEETRAVLQSVSQTLQELPVKMLIYRQDGIEVFSSGLDTEERKWAEKVIKEHFTYFLEEKEASYSQTQKGMFYEMGMTRCSTGQNLYYNFFIKVKKVRALQKESGIRVYNYKEFINQKERNAHRYISFTGELSEILREYAKEKEPVVLVGESGTGKEKGAGLIYEWGPYGNHPLYVIDFDKLEERQWKFFIHHENSPLFYREITIYFKNINSCQKEKRNALFYFLEQEKLWEKNRLIFSVLLNKGLDEEEVLTQLTNAMSFSSIYFPALRERLHDIPELAGLYLNEVNTALCRQVIGFEPGAMELMKKYAWPHNLNQFKRIIKELVFLTQTPYITYDTVYQVLKKESYSGAKEVNGQYALDLNQSLKEIEKDIIKIILEEEKGNQSSTARRLGISRGTLWRYLKEQYENGF